MKLALLVGLGLVGSGAASTLAVPEQAPSPQFPAGIELVTIDAVVLDGRGNPIEGLTQADFLVSEDGKPQTVASFEAIFPSASEPVEIPPRARVSTNALSPQPQQRRTFVIVFDDVHMASDRLDLARKAVGDFVRGGLRPGDQVTLVPTSGGAWWTAEVPAGAEGLGAALERLKGLRQPSTSPDNVSDYEAMQIYLQRDEQALSRVARRYYERRLLLESMQTGEGKKAEVELQVDRGLPLVQAKSAEVYQAALDRKRITLGVLRRVVESLASAKGRKSVILVSEGFVHEPQLPEFRELVRSGREANAAIYFLDARGLRGGLTLAFDAETTEMTDPRDIGAILEEDLLAAGGADSIAVDTGGFSLKNANDMGAGLRRIVRESGSYYLLGYLPKSHPRDGKFHRIGVKVRRPDVQVRARRGYYARTEEETPAPRGVSPDPAVRRALDSPFLGGEIPLRMTAYVLGAASPGKVSVLLVAEADPSVVSFEQEGGRFNGTLESQVEVSSRQTGESVTGERLMELSLPPEVKLQLERSWVPLIRDFELAPGVYQARLLLRDRRGKRVGTVRHEFEVPAVEALRVSTPVLTDTLQPAPEGSGAPPRPVPVAHRTFGVGRALYYAFEVHGARADASGTTKVSVAYHVASASGARIAEQPAQALVPGPQGALGQMFNVPVQDLGPGAYAIGLLVRDEVAGRSFEVTDLFTVAGP